MPICKLLFNVPPDITVNAEDLKDDVLELVSLLNRNGQIISEGGVCIINGCQAYIDVLCQELTSLNTRNNNRYINHLIENIHLDHQAVFSYEVMDESNNQDGFSAYQSADFFILHWKHYSPLMSGNSFEPIPLYYFPYSDHDKQSYNDIHFWQNNYDRIYGLWRSGEIDESIFYNYLSNINSPLNKQGLACCRNLEQLVDKAVYYYLFYYGDEPQASDCPGCGRSWRLQTPLFDTFHFKCDHCSIVSNE